MREMSVLWCLLGATWLWQGCSKTEPKPVCERGSIGCGCAEADRCEEGASCDQNLCVREGVLELSVSEPRARGCEVLLEDRGPLAKVEFTDAVQGAFVKEAPRTAVAFVSRQDTSIPEASVLVHFADHGKGAPEVKVTNCTDSAGAPIKASIIASLR